MSPYASFAARDVYRRCLSVVAVLTEQVHVGAGQQLVQHVEVALAVQHAAHALLRHATVQYAPHARHASLAIGTFDTTRLVECATVCDVNTSYWRPASGERISFKQLLKAKIKI